MQVRRGDIVIVELNPTKGSDTVGYNDVKILHTPGYRNPSRDDSRQYQRRIVARYMIYSPSRATYSVSPSGSASVSHATAGESYPSVVNWKSASTALATLSAGR